MREIVKAVNLSTKMLDTYTRDVTKLLEYLTEREDLILEEEKKMKAAEERNDYLKNMLARLKNN